MWSARVIENVNMAHGGVKFHNCITGACWAHDDPAAREKALPDSPWLMYAELLTCNSYGQSATHTNVSEFLRSIKPSNTYYCLNVKYLR
jgi:hypothetical protein